MRSIILFLAAAASAGAQAPNGIIAGVVRDPSGAAVKDARIQAMSAGTGLARNAASSPHGDFSFPALLSGEYEVSVEAAGFQRMARAVTVEAGATTTTDFDLHLGQISDSITIDGASPQIRYDSHSVGGLITRGQIEDLPVNGRSFLELAKLEPGVQALNRAANNRQGVPTLGGPGGNLSGRGTRVTVDGGSIMAFSTGGSVMGLSQEAVQEFQISTVNLDLSTGLTATGAVNAITRSGGNDLHGTAFYFFRDHTLAAYPALNRDRVNPDPFFQRRQFGFALGGPIRRNRAFSSPLGSATSNAASLPPPSLTRTSGTSAGSLPRRCSETSLVCGWTVESRTSTRRSCATPMTAATHLRRSSELRARWRIPIHPTGPVRWSGPTRVSSG